MQAILDIAPVESARLSRFKPLENVEGARVAVMVAHAPAGLVKPNVPVYSAALRRAGLSVVLIVASDRPVVVDSDLVSTLSGGFARENCGFDFGAWAHVLKVAPALWRAETLFLVNDSVIGPLSQQRLDRLLQRVSESPADVVGATDNHEFEWHLQSYFVALKSRALASKALRTFFGEVRNLPDKEAVVHTYEIPLARVLGTAGLVCEAIYPSADGVNPTTSHWRALIDDGFPFVKTEVLRGLNPDWDIAGWPDVLAATGFDPAVAAATVEAGNMATDLEAVRDDLAAQPNPPSTGRDRSRQLATEQLARDYDELKTERDALAHDNKRLHAAHDALLASTSWRLTAPLRRLRRLLSR
jgi:hypothetical protein